MTCTQSGQCMCRVLMVGGALSSPATGTATPRSLAATTVAPCGSQAPVALRCLGLKCLGLPRDAR